MDRWRGKVAVVTGAASGIGAAISCKLLDAGVNVVGLDLQITRLREQSENQQKLLDPTAGSLYALECDLAKEKDLVEAFRWVEERFSGLQILVNNAGVVDYTPIIGHVIPEGSVTDHDGSIQRDDGVASVTLGWNLYPASKHAAVAMTHTIRREICRAGVPIRITSISPGLVKTEISKHVEALRGFFDKVPALNPADIADALIYALSTRPEVQITELTVQRTGEP